MDYNPKDANSIMSKAMTLVGKSLSEYDNAKHGLLLTNKGRLGTLVERVVFKWNPDNSNGLPDFPDAGIELKTTGLIRGARGIRAKERLVLTKINYHTIINESWPSNALLKKTERLLLLFYIYEMNTSPLDQRFIDARFWSIPPEDMPIICKDWELIRDKVKQGLAHELSGGDTYYLEACTKGSDGDELTTQPNSATPAKPRAFAYKAAYVKTMIAKDLVAESLVEKSKSLDIEQYSIDTVAKFIGKSQPHLHNMVGEGLNPKSKSYLSSLAIRMLGVKTKVEEFEKAGIIIKTVRLKKNGKPQESMSFRNFKPTEIIEQKWEESNFHESIESRFLFVIFQYNDERILEFRGIKFWAMPYLDREEAKRVWNKTKEQVLAGDYDSLPRKSESRVAHVRPKGRNAKDTYITPQGTRTKKKCFWLNNTYIQEIVSNDKI